MFLDPLFESGVVHLVWLDVSRHLSRIDRWLFRAEEACRRFGYPCWLIPNFVCIGIRLNSPFFLFSELLLVLVLQIFAGDQALYLLTQVLDHPWLQ